MKKSKILIDIFLDDQKHPSKIEWQADDDKAGTKHTSKAMLLSFFDKDSLDTMKIDLWTSDMQINEMDRFFFQTFKALCDTYYKSTGNDALASQMQNFTQFFGEQTGIIPKDKDQQTS